MHSLAAEHAEVLSGQIKPFTSQNTSVHQSDFLTACIMLHTFKHKRGRSEETDRQQERSNLHLWKLHINMFYNMWLNCIFLVVTILLLLHVNVYKIQSHIENTIITYTTRMCVCLKT